MALPTDIHDQLSRMEQRLRLVPPDEVPPPATVRAQVRLWQEHVHAAAETLRWADATIEVLAGLPEAVERDRLLALLRAVRARASDLMQRLNPEQAWFWTEEWQAGERDVDREIAAARGQVFTSDEEFDAALDALDAERAALG